MELSTAFCSRYKLARHTETGTDLLTKLMYWIDRRLKGIGSWSEVEGSDLEVVDFIAYDVPRSPHQE